MKKFKLLISAIALLISCAIANAQNIKVSGTVVDQSGLPLPGVGVMVEGSRLGTATDGAGKYSISGVPSNATLVFSSIGYTETKVPVNGRASIPTVTLKEDAQMLEETVVVGYGSGQKVANVVGSVKTVKSETIKHTATSSPLDMLQGQVAGLSVLTTGGVAGDNNVSLTLHGVGSLSSGTAPLYILDGVPSTSSSVMALNPNDIASISILKDASATSIYGSRAANGVVYVTTKAGQFNQHAKISARSQFGISTLADFTMYNNMMSGDELKDFWIRSGIYTYDYVQSTYTDHGYTYNTKWHEYMQQFNNPQSQNDITIEGGSRTVSYMISAGQFHQRGNTIGNVYDRYTVRSNIQAVPKEWLKLGINLGLSYSKSRSNGNWGSSSSVGGNNYLTGGLSMLLNPLFPAIDPVTDKEYAERYPNGIYNQHFITSNRYTLNQRYGLQTSAFVLIEPIRHLKFQSRVGLDGYLTNATYHSNPSLHDKYSSYTAGKQKGEYFSYTATITNTVEYSFELNPNHKFSVLGGHEGLKYYYDFFYAGSSNQTDDRLINLQNGTQASYAMSESHTDMATLSFFGHADYTLMDKYIFDLTVRRDASSRFGRNVRWAPFWSFGALWKAKREPFLQNVAWLDDLNVKLSYGTQGNSSIDDYLPYATISASSNYADATGLYVSSPSNYNLTWEKQGLLTLAFSGRAFNRLDFDIEFYNRQTRAMLMDVPQPYTTGFSSVTSNVGGLNNKGIDITLGFDILRQRDYFLRVGTTFNYNKEKITELFDGRTEWEISNTGITYVVGQPIMFYYPIYAGVDPADGKMQWYLPGSDKNVTTKDKTTKVFDEGSLMQNTGCKRNAPINGGFNLSGGWRGISVNMDFAYVLGKWLINNDAFFYANPNQFAGYNTTKGVSDFWTPTNTSAQYPDWSTGAKMQFDTHLLENASFLRMKNLTVAYDLPKKFLAWTNGVLSNVRVSFTGRNLLTFTKYKGSDPEANSNLVLGLPGSSKQFLGGIELTF